ncbi:MAG: class I SAM-dependent methyltransferase [Microgenomates group bacterium]
MKKNEYKKMFDFENQHFWFIGKKYFIKTLLDRYLPKKGLKILDVGCGTGGLTSFLNNYGQTVGIEKNKYAIKSARQRNLNIKLADAQKIPFSSNSFDLVTIFDVLYHKNVKNEERVILEAKRVLKKDGFLLIADSAFSFLKSQHDKILHGNKRFTISYLSNLLNKNGFNALRSSYIFFLIFPFIFLKRKFF